MRENMVERIFARRRQSNGANLRRIKIDETECIAWEI